MNTGKTKFDETFWSAVHCDNCEWEGKENELDGMKGWGCPCCGSDLHMNYESDGTAVLKPEED